MIREWEKNAFWENPENKILKAILTITNDVGVKTTQQVTVAEKAFNGDENPDFKEIMEQVGLEIIDKNTKERADRRDLQMSMEKKRRDDAQKAKDLEQLFESKLKAFEIEEVKKSNNRALKTKLRRAKSKIEVNIYTMMIVMEEMSNETPSEN